MTDHTVLRGCGTCANYQADSPHTAYSPCMVCGYPDYPKYRLRAVTAFKTRNLDKTQAVDEFLKRAVETNASLADVTFSVTFNLGEIDSKIADAAERGVLVIEIQGRRYKLVKE